MPSHVLNGTLISKMTHQEFLSDWVGKLHTQEKWHSSRIDQDRNWAWSHHNTRKSADLIKEDCLMTNNYRQIMLKKVEISLTKAHILKSQK